MQRRHELVLRVEGDFICSRKLLAQKCSVVARLDAETEQRALHRVAVDDPSTVDVAKLRIVTEDGRLGRFEQSRLLARVDRPTARTLEALIRTLNEDPNVNVRLAAVDALFLFRGNPAVKESLVLSLSRQESPLVQVALIDLLVEIRERRAVEALKSLIGTAKLNPEVKHHAELGLKQII
jgi:HEAT repeat protein